MSTKDKYRIVKNHPSMPELYVLEVRRKLWFFKWWEIVEVSKNLTHLEVLKEAYGGV